MTDVEWWPSNAPLLGKIMDSTRFPVASRVGEAAGRPHQAISNPAHALTFGLDRILDGVTALIASRDHP